MSGELDRMIFAHLQTCEESLLDPAVRRDSEQLADLLSDDFVEFGSSGRVWSREQIIELLATEDYRPPTVENFACAWLGDGVVLATYRTVRTKSDSGSVQTRKSAVLRSSIWVKEGDIWRIRFHQGTKEL